MRSVLLGSFLAFLLACNPEGPAAPPTSGADAPVTEADDESPLLRRIPDGWDVTLLPQGFEGLLINSKGLVVGRQGGLLVLYNTRTGRSQPLPAGEPVAINDKDEVLINREGKATLWSRARSIDLGTLGGEPTVGVDLNNLGHVAGMSGATPFLWTPQRGMRAILGRGAPEHVWAMNGVDQMVGRRLVSEVAHIVVWSPDGRTRDAGLAEPAECPPLVHRRSGTCVLMVMGLDNHGGIGGLIGSFGIDPIETAGFVLSRRGMLEAFQGVGRDNRPSGYTDSGFMPMSSWSSTVASVRLPDGRVVPLFDELGGQSDAIAASWDGHILGYGTISASEFRFSILSPRYGPAH